MKVKLLTLSLLVLCTTVSFAQSNHQQIKESLQLKAKQKHDKMLKSLINNDFNIEAKKTRGGSRLISYATNNVVSAIPPVIFEPGDSTHYKYNANYGYDITPDIFAQEFDISGFTSSKQNYFDHADMWVNDGSGSLVPFDSADCKFGSNHKITNENYDYFYYGFQAHFGYSYDGSGRKVLELDSTFMAPDTFVQKYILAYDASNRLIYDEYQEWDNTSNVYTPSYYDSIFYDASNRISVVKEFSYDVPSSSWVKSYLMNLTYNAAGKMILADYQIWNGTSWDNNYKIEKTYNGLNQVVSSSYYSWLIPTSAWRPEEKDSFQYTSSSYPSVRIYQQYDTVISTMLNVNKFNYTYNTSNQIAKMYTYDWDGSSWTDYSDANFHYEYYNPEAVNETFIEAGRIKVYPSPSNGTLYVAANWNEKQAATINVLDINGKLLMSKPVMSSLNMNESINISSLSSGVYLLQIKGEKGSLTQKIVRE